MRRSVINVRSTSQVVQPDNVTYMLSKHVKLGNKLTIGQ